MAELEPKMSSYLHSRGIKLGFPVSGTFELTGRCNFNCKMCYVHSADTSSCSELSVDEWLDIAENAKKAGTLFLLLTGGEPLLYKDFPVLYKALCKMGFVISVNTNGSLIDEKIIDLFKEYPPFRINISLYGASEDTYENLCENRKFTRVTENIRLLSAMGLSIRLNCVFNSFNCSDIEEIHKIAAETGILLRPAAYMYPPLRAKGETGENIARLSPEKAAECSFKCKQLEYSEETLRNKAAQLMRNDCLYDDELSENHGIRCRAGRSSFWVTHDGSMTPCGMMATPSVSLKEHSFSECWQSIRQKTAEIRLPKECITCRHRKNCSVCAAMCYSETGAFDGKPEYVCRMTDALTKLFVESYGGELK